MPSAMFCGYSGERGGIFGKTLCSFPDQPIWSTRIYPFICFHTYNSTRPELLYLPLNFAHTLPTPSRVYPSFLSSNTAYAYRIHRTAILTCPHLPPLLRLPWRLRVYVSFPAPLLDDRARQAAHKFRAAYSFLTHIYIDSLTLLDVMHLSLVSVLPTPMSRITILE